MSTIRNVFLFGAGATFDWGSPSTPDLTAMVRKYAFKTADGKTTVTDYIYQRLLENGYSDTEVNFETIINVIEEMVVYYSRFNQERELPSLMKTFFSSVHESQLLNYSIEGGEERHGFRLQIPAGVEYFSAQYAHQGETPQQFYFQHLLAELLSTISGRISKYAYHTEGHSVINPNSPISQSFTRWMSTLAQRGILRLYTLNYERIFKVLLCKAGLNVFEGFDCGEFVGSSEVLRANVRRILQDTACHSFYNLHGSAFWDVLDLDKEQLPNPEIVMRGAPYLQCNNTPASFQMEKGKTLLVTNIITGYQKAQKSMLTPMRQMQHAFDRDCCFADQLFVIGYSFGDEHINESIKTAIRHNPDIKITIVDPSFIKNNMDYQFAIRMFPYKESPFGHFNPKKVADNLYSFFDGAFTVHTLGFKEFLEQQNSGSMSKYRASFQA
jgi:hypothetical protein